MRPCITAGGVLAAALFRNPPTVAVPAAFAATTADQEGLAPSAVLRSQLPTVGVPPICYLEHHRAEARS